MWYRAIHSHVIIIEWITRGRERITGDSASDSESLTQSQPLQCPDGAQCHLYSYILQRKKGQLTSIFFKTSMPDLSADRIFLQPDMQWTSTWRRLFAQRSYSPCAHLVRITSITYIPWYPPRPDCLLIIRLADLKRPSVSDPMIRRECTMCGFDLRGSSITIKIRETLRLSHIRLNTPRVPAHCKLAL